MTTPGRDAFRGWRRGPEREQLAAKPSCLERMAHHLIAGHQGIGVHLLGDPACRLTARKGLALDGSHPTMMYGYGGFSISTLVGGDVWLRRGGNRNSYCVLAWSKQFFASETANASSLAHCDRATSEK